MRKTITKLLGWKSENTYYDWKKQNRPILNLLEKYFNENDLEEFLKYKKIDRLDKLKLSEEKVKENENLLIDHAIYTVKEKVKNRTHLTYKNKEVIIKGCINIIEDENVNYNNIKQKFIDSLKNVEIAVFGIKHIKAPKKSKDIAKWAKYNLSNIEIHALIYSYKKIFNLIDEENK